MLDMLAAASNDVLRWSELGLKPGIDLGFFTLRFYSLAYIAGLVVGYWHLSKMVKAPGAPMAQVHVDDLFFYCMLGIIIGGRLGYLTFYEPGLWTDFSGEGWVSWRALRMWDGGMSFHGGVIGTVIAIAYVSWRGGLPFIRVCDYIATNVGFGMFFGRIANFINGELWGRPAGEGVPWAMTFCDQAPRPGIACASSNIARHPSQLYEAGLEGLLVVVVLLSLFWLTRARYRPALLVGVFTVMISAGRFIVEFFREPDSQLADFAARSGLNMGQWLTIPLFLVGCGLVIWALMRPPVASGASVRARAAAKTPAPAAPASGRSGAS
ncbi:prolipoprotein diacylglyceryl transferase [Aurantiacibacter spongiae]|uniref:Phosphatidylglycerol--prolipoprotein diacylglyceryl transferase n=1 Tax=Aurantiacibacter spongiae TaxID=2488860 RepID=A0A3N5CTG2_9SPHN|nr:prolipoprotein diacylglyceryl transferase [Aurantiacibacter spongiae]RPF71596.1 prolipoprotein diacylglyceryl transferase [Aurantiacibacter spongiae]